MGSAMISSWSLLIFLLYLRKHWRCIQYLVNQFGSDGGLSTLKICNSEANGIHLEKNFSVGEVVLLKEDNQPRNEWRLCRVVEVEIHDDLCVTQMYRVGQPNIDNKGRRRTSDAYLERPIHKLVLLKETEEIPDEEP